ncbi:COP9 signalosome catalytic subunit rri1 [Tulasnella sp. JGI-2019a]|nr:COP9 signalosome catalytic subunit rri1 [Tulasnella sp. JGI-2019a]
MASSSGMAMKTFELSNDIREIDPADQIFQFDAALQKSVNKAEPWAKDPHYFTSVKISAIALIKMVIHARSGGIYEIMGLMYGKVQGTSMVIMDSFALPVQGTETRVNAQNEANEFMIQYLDGSNKAGRQENIIGWYHSHPGYGCWLSGIDVNTQLTNQKYQDPFVAVVIDPNRTISAGKVDIGAFRTYPEDYKPPTSSSEYQSIPLSKIEDFGVHANQYYSLEVEIFKSKLDNELLGLLWNKYWVNTLSSSPLISNRAYAVSQLSDLAAKLVKGQQTAQQRRNNPDGLTLPKKGTMDDGSGGVVMSTPNASPVTKGGSGAKGKDKGAAISASVKPVGKTPAQEDGKPKEDTALLKAVKDSAKIASEAQHGLISQVLKDVIFSNRPGGGGLDAAPLDASIGNAMTS